jgi:hypothetical protein
MSALSVSGVNWTLRGETMSKYEKLERDGNVAVLISPGYGAGWYSWNSKHEGMLFDRDIAEFVLAGKQAQAVAVAERKYPGIYKGGGDDLTVAWVPKGQRFEVDEYDGNESIRYLAPDDGHVA